MHLEVVLSILLGVLFGITCAILAKDKGRSPVNWFIIGLLFGLIGLVVLLFMPRLKKTEEEQQSQTNVEPKLEPIEEVESQEEPPSINSPPTLLEIYQMSSWYYLDDKHTQIGPVDFQRVAKAWKEGEVFLGSYVWTEGMANWQKIDALPDLKKLLRES